jgi:hypothetical protein
MHCTVVNGHHDRFGILLTDPRDDTNSRYTIVCCVNFCKLLAIVYTICRFVGVKQNLYPLTLLGDALSSFLESPDHTTILCGLAKKEEIWKNESVWERKEAHEWRTRSQRWFRSSSLRFRIAAFLA